ncbi:N-acetyl-gamma-glutamyl-phosphate reductase [Solirubrobacter ginsenosidimutans]|uniref:N-acetyl-gamma-glutamyl-phosphate reductase n=1 Tax=Solirubrobacter ginsenosidimutans TaxID=490573 RepID=A0A9X3S5H6_9ACTN|nr:N-acetyl-gamma-glutamyl-phosphate reductase [Solirubrobacter ginsenosidimutans]MDA0164176.1 N-acetyl-gamma-glutamyl-phosphate reductase [Solirubrobacter ginsenosidimutans]
MVEVSVLGGVGYAGAIAAQLLYRHPFFKLAHVTARAEAGQRLDDVHPRTRVPLELEIFDVSKHAVDAAVVAYPHGAAAPVVAELRAAGTRVVDLSADFRLRDRAIYDDWYGEHKAPELFGQGVYGLPELTRAQVAGADLVANPGCYPTAALLGLAPLAKAGVIGDVVIDAKSGVSGAGRAPTHATHFISANENVSPYKINGHRHTPEIEQELGVLGATLPITFMPHLLPLDQGELVTAYVTPSAELSEDELVNLYDDSYAREPFVELRTGPVGVIDVRDTNFCRISWVQDPRTGRIIVFSAIDNLWKGAASQAVQNLNLMFDRPETEGLL